MEREKVSTLEDDKLNQLRVIENMEREKGRLLRELASEKEIVARLDKDLASLAKKEKDL